MIVVANFLELESICEAQINIPQNIKHADIPKSCRKCIVRKTGLCCELSPQQLNMIDKSSSRRTRPKNSEIITSEESVRRYANIISGVAKLTKLMADGRQQIVGLHFASDLLGQPFKAQSNIYAEAVTDVSTCSVPADLLEKFILETPELEHHLHKQALNQLDEAREWMLTLGRKTAAEKVASFVYMVATRIDPEAVANQTEIRFKIPLKRADIADFLGLTTETVFRQMTKLRKASIFEIENNRTVIIGDLSKLQRICEIQ